MILLKRKTKSRRFPNQSFKLNTLFRGWGHEKITKELAAYNIWANQRILEVILALPEEKQKQELPSSFKSLYHSVLHMWNAENIWWQRMKLQERITKPSILSKDLWKNWQTNRCNKIVNGRNG